MLKIIKNTIKYKYCHLRHKEDENNYFIIVLNELNNLIYSKLSNIPLNDKYDLYQEICLKIKKVLLSFKINKYSKDLEKIEKIKMKYNLNKLTSYEYNLYVNQLQFCKYVSVLINNHIFDYYRKKNRKRKIIITNIKSTHNKYKNIIIELINCNKNKEDIKIKKMINFLKEFIDDDKLLTEREVASKLLISQQAVHKRKKNYLNKLLQK